MRTSATKLILVIIILGSLPILFMNCGTPTSPSMLTSGIGEEEQASDVCSDLSLNELENKMKNSLKNVTTDHSFYIELQRPAIDGRIFTFSRDIDGTIDKDTTMKSASTAKMVSSSIILDVVSNPQNYPGQGMVNGKKLSLDSLARDFLPDSTGGSFWETKSGPLATTNRLYSVTLRHLLSFTSGLEVEKSLIGPNCIGVPESTFTHGDCVRNLVTVNQPRNTDPNTPRTFYYNGAHLSVASLMAVKAAGMTNWAELFKRYKELHQVFQGSTIPAAPASTAGPGAYYPFSDKNSSPNPAGAFRYRAGDYTIFLKKLYLGDILSDQTLNEMLSDQLEFLGAVIKYAPTVSNSEDWHYGLGLWSECYSETWTPSCIVDRYSSPGSFGSYPFIDFNYYGNTPYPLVGFLARGGTDTGTASKGIEIYRSLRTTSNLKIKDLAQNWAANKCP